MLKGVTVSFVLFPMEEGVGISARSQGDINVQVMMEQLGGGGHQMVAGAQVKNESLLAVKSKVIDIITKYIGESERHEINSAARSEKSRLKKEI